MPLTRRSSSFVALFLSCLLMLLAACSTAPHGTATPTATTTRSAATATATIGPTVTATPLKSSKSVSQCIILNAHLARCSNGDEIEESIETQNGTPVGVFKVFRPMSWYVVCTLTGEQVLGIVHPVGEINGAVWLPSCGNYTVVQVLSAENSTQIFLVTGKTGTIVTKLVIQQVTTMVIIEINKGGLQKVQTEAQA